MVAFEKIYFKRNILGKRNKYTVLYSSTKGGGSPGVLKVSH